MAKLLKYEVGTSGGDIAGPYAVHFIIDDLDLLKRWALFLIEAEDAPEPPRLENDS